MVELSRSRLTVIIRYLVVAGTAVVFNLLSVGAACGLLLVVLYNGFSVGLLGFDHFFFSSRRRHTFSTRDWSSDVCSSDLRPSWSTRATPARSRARSPRRSRTAAA